MIASSVAKAAIKDFKEYGKSRNHDRKEQNYVLVANLKEMEICNLPNKEFKIIVLRKLSELQENTDRNSTKSKNNT